MENRLLEHPELLERCEKIRDLIKKASKTKAGKEYYGAHYHHYQLMPPASIEEILEFEQKHHVTLPIEYVCFLTQVGRGGAGPGNGLIHGFPDIYVDDEWISVPSEQLSCEMTDEEWEEKYGSESGYDAELPREAGTIDLTGMDLTYIAHLVVTGKEKGKIVYLDYDGDLPPIWPKSCNNFLDWYENWFTELASGYRMLPFGQSMWQEIGDEAALIDSFQRAQAQKYKEEVLCSFTKFPGLSGSTIQFLKEMQPPYAELASKILERFKV